MSCLNAHADPILSNPKCLTEKRHESLEKIIELLQRFGSDEGYEDLWEDAYQLF